jgi:iron complex outermembrane receptor protein
MQSIKLAIFAGLFSLICAARFAAAATVGAAETTDTSGLEEVTVTAERYKSTIQDTPISISAMTGDQLTAAGLTRIQDIAHEIPGLSTRSAGPGLTEYEARGLASNGGAAPTVGFYLDEIPLSPPACIAAVGSTTSPSVRFPSTSRPRSRATCWQVR